ncbi:MAG TPA: pyridoxal-dependent decarboxylase [Terriglobales bacterium]|nr:pyridoxal-dependent decarboxylase [Terriglobales bacterium]
MLINDVDANIVLDELKNYVTKCEREIANGPIVPTVTPEVIRAHLSSSYNFETPKELNDVVADVERMLRTWQVQVTHPRYLGLFNPSVTLASVVADVVVAMYNPQLATWRTSPAANEIERHTLGWLAGKFGFSGDSVASFTSGGAESNLSAVIVALTRAFPGYGEGGLRHLVAAPTIYLTDEAHHGFNKIAHMAGIGRQALRKVRTDRDLKMDLADLARQVAEDRKAGFAPFMVIGTAGTTAAGIIDPLPGLARFCQSEDLWFHVDAAWGGAAIISPRLRGHLTGIGAADSITCDAHKWFSVPMGAGMFFCRHRDAVGNAFRSDTFFMPAKTAGTFDPHATSVQWSRRFIGLKLFLTLAHHGESGYIEMIERQAQLGDMLRRLLRRAGWRTVNSTPLPLVCFTRDGLVTSEFLAALYERQIAWMSEVRLGDSPPVVRACITSFRTTESDIEGVVREMSRIVGGTEVRT